MKKQILFATSIALSLSMHAQIITTIAGDGIAGFSGDGSAATAANFNNPIGIAFDAAGNLYIADALNERIRKVNTLGVITTIAGTGVAGFSGNGGPATAAQFDYPQAVAFDSRANLYIVDGNNNCVRKIDTAGIVTIFAGSGLAGYSGDNGAATLATLNSPSGVTVDTSGNVYIADSYNSCIRRVDTAGIIKTFAGYSGDGGMATSARLNNPTTVAVDTSGNVYIADLSNNCIRKINTAGIIHTIAGNGGFGFSGDGGVATVAQLNSPWGVTVDPAGNVIIADQYNNRIRKVSVGGIINTIAGNGSAVDSGDGRAATVAALYNPAEVAFDAAGNLYIADLGNRIRKVALNSVTTSVKEISNFSFVSIYPNPTTGTIYISCPDKTVIKVYNLTGKLLKEKGNTGDISIVELPAGVYLLKIYDEQNQLIQQDKIVKQ